MSGEIIEKPPSRIAILSEHGTGFIGMVISLVWISTIVAVSYLDAIKLDIFLDTWYSSGIWYVLISVLASFVAHIMKFIFGRVQMVQAYEVMKDLITSLCYFLLYTNYPLDLGDFDSTAQVFLIFIAVLSVLSAITNLYKTINWDSSSDRSIHKAV